MPKHIFACMSDVDWSVKFILLCLGVSIFYLTNGIGRTGDSYVYAFPLLYSFNLRNS